MVAFEDVRRTPETTSVRISPAQCDVNGHLTVRHQIGLHDDGGWELLGSLGMGLRQVAAGDSYFDVEQHLRYVSEAVSGDDVSIHHRLLDVSTKALHFMSYLVCPERAAVVSSFECVVLAVNLTTRGVRQFAPHELERLVVRTRNDRALTWDAGACGAMGVRSSVLSE